MCVEKLNSQCYGVLRTNSGGSSASTTTSLRVVPLQPLASEVAEPPKAAPKAAAAAPEALGSSDSADEQLTREGPQKLA